MEPTVMVGGIPTSLLLAAMLGLFFSAPVGIGLALLCLLFRPLQFLSPYLALIPLMGLACLFLTHGIPEVLASAVAFALPGPTTFQSGGTELPSGRLFDQWSWRAGWTGFILVPATVGALMAANAVNAVLGRRTFDFHRLRVILAVAAALFGAATATVGLVAAVALAPYFGGVSGQLTQKAVVAAAGKPYCILNNMSRTTVNSFEQLPFWDRIYQAVAYKMGWPNRVTESGGWRERRRRGPHFAIVTADAAFSWSFDRQEFVPNSTYSAFGRSTLQITIDGCFHPEHYGRWRTGSREPAPRSVRFGGESR